MKLSEARDILGRFLFSGDDQFKKIEMLSGGERGRVALAKLTLQGANLLLLDEPTNHLDIPSQEVITEALKHFDGTLLFVSHDRYLIAALATQLWMLDTDEVAGTQLTVFKGTYDAWRNAKDEARWAEIEAAAARQSAPPAKGRAASAIAAPAQPVVGATDAAAARMSKNQQQQRLIQLEVIEKRIGELEKKLAELSVQMETIGGDYARLKTLAADYKATEAALTAAWSEFEEIA